MISIKKPIPTYITPRNVSLAFLVFYLIHVTMITLVIEDEWNRTVFNDLAIPIEGIVAVAALAWATLRSGNYSRQLFVAWGLLAAGQLAWTLGDINWFVQQVVLRETPFPSLTDACYILWFTLFIVGVLKLPMKRLKASEWLKFSLDLGIITLSALLVYWYFYINHLLKMGKTDLSTLIVAFTYPAFDFLLLMVLFLLLARRLKVQARGPVILLVVSMSLKITADVALGYQFTMGTYVTRLYIDMGWIATVFLAGLAGVLQAMTVDRSAAEASADADTAQTDAAIAPWAMYVPYFWLVGAYILMMTSYRSDLEINFPTLVVWVGMVMLLVVIRQITAFTENKRLLDEQKWTEKALRESERQYRSLFENSLDTIFTVDTKGNFTSINRAAETLTGYTREELIGKSYREFVDEKLGRIIYRFFDDLYRTGVPKSGTRLEIKTKNGEARIVEGFANLIRNGGEIVGFQGTLRDVTERTKLEQQLVQSQKMEAIGTMAGGIAHNFNNIMVGIMGYSELLLMGKTREDPDYRALTVIHEGTLRASALTKQILNISRGAHYNIVKINLNRLIEKTVPLIAGTFVKSIEVKTCLGEDLMSIEGDANQLEQCLLNLSINARDAMPGGGLLTFETRNEVLDKEFVESHFGHIPGPHVVLSVTDVGVGISPELLDHIFEPFFTTKHDSGGSGIGLATVYGIVKGHKGFITVYSEVGRGTTFNLYFPAARGSSEESARVEGKSGKPSLPAILLIDDEPAVREVWSDYLMRRGYRVLTAENGLVGTEVFRSHADEIGVVILDMVMPELGGKETLDRLREIKPTVKVIITSGYSEQGQAGEFESIQKDAFVQKPTQLSLLQKKIDEVLGR